MGVKIKGMRVIILLTWISATSLLGHAQSNLVFYHEDEQFNASDFNPAFLNSQRKFTFSIFPLAGMSVGYNNQEVIKDVMTQFLKGNQDNESFKGVFNSLVEQELFSLNYETNLLQLGYHSKIGSFNFRIKENVRLLTDFKGELSDFLNDPAFQNLIIGQPQFFPAEALHYREYSLGFAKELIKDKLSVGVRPKVYFGKSILYSEVSGAVIQRADTFYTQIEGPMRLSIPANPDFNDQYLNDLNIADAFNLGSYATNAKNVGVGIDIGINYKITPEFEFSASVIDLGGIKWKKNINTQIFDDEFAFKENIEVSLNENGRPVLTKFDARPLADTLTFRLSIDESPFSKPLPTTFYAGLRYHINPKLTLGVVDRYFTAKDFKYNSLSLTANYNLNEKITLISGYSIIGNSFKNLPIALLYKRRSGQTYIGTDNILSFIAPSFSDYAGISFGTCFYLFRNREIKYEDSPEYLPFYKPRK
jgi:hypothetical protein